jgi:hypothetical protein
LVPPTRTPKGQSISAERGAVNADLTKGHQAAHELEKWPERFLAIGLWSGHLARLSVVTCQRQRGDSSNAWTAGEFRSALSVETELALSSPRRFHGRAEIKVVLLLQSSDDGRESVRRHGAELPEASKGDFSERGPRALAPDDQRRPGRDSNGAKGRPAPTMQPARREARLDPGRRGIRPNIRACRTTAQKTRRKASAAFSLWLHLSAGRRFISRADRAKTPG